MKRVQPLLLIVTVAVLLVAGIAWKIADAGECVDGGGAVIAPMTRGQGCAGR
jgi:hypothetical protein